MLTTMFKRKALQVSGVAISSLLAPFLLLEDAQAILLEPAQTQSFTNQLTELNGTPSLTFNQYSGSGTLEEVVFIVSVELMSFGFVVNMAGSPETFLVGTQGYYDLLASADAPSGLTDLSLFGDRDTLIADTIGVQLFIGLLGSESFGPFSITNSTGGYSTTDVTGFVGSGNYSYEPQTDISVINNNPNVTTNISTFASASVTVEYYGTPVPWETDVLPLVGATILFGGGMWWKRRRQASAVTDLLAENSELTPQTENN